MRLISALILAALPLTATAQDRAGRDTPGDWLVTHQQAFGLWDSFCDERTEDAGLVQRCYLRYVEGYSARPNFGAAFVFVTPDGLNVGMERGSRFGPDGLRIEDAAGEPIWAEARVRCLALMFCDQPPGMAQETLAVMAAGAALHLEFTDPTGVERDLEWDLTRFAEALADWRAQSEARGLPAL